LFTSYVKWVHCHHGMARPRVADREDGLQIWRVAANILNKQSQIAESRWSSSLGVGRGITTLPHKTQSLRAATEQDGLLGPKERHHLEDQGVGGKMGSEWILGRLAWGVWIGFDWLRTGTFGGLV
jgi:hypothetical protein